MIAGWDDFFTAQVGASAALAGLIFVGVSINMPKIISSPILPNRALQALLILVVILVVSSLLLVPGQALFIVGVEVLATGAAIRTTNTLLDARAIRKVDAQYRQPYLRNLVLSQVATIPYLVGGVVILAAGAVGLYWVVAAIILSFLKAIIDAWVLLVEINR
jgi:hypothetical protein